MTSGERQDSALNNPLSRSVDGARRVSLSSRDGAMALDLAYWLTICPETKQQVSLALDSPNAHAKHC